MILIHFFVTYYLFIYLFLIFLHFDITVAVALSVAISESSPRLVHGRAFIHQHCPFQVWHSIIWSGQSLYTFILCLRSSTHALHFQMILFALFNVYLIWFVCLFPDKITVLLLRLLPPGHRIGKKPMEVLLLRLPWTRAYCSAAIASSAGWSAPHCPFRQWCFWSSVLLP